MKTGQEHTTLLLNARQVASMLGISSRTVWRLKDAEKLPMPVRLGSSVRWDRQSLIRFVDLGCDIARFDAVQEVRNAS
jgi:predicted DNA-binding transcriptional regulator AlpA